MPKYLGLHLEKYTRVITCNIILGIKNVTVHPTSDPRKFYTVYVIDIHHIVV